MGGFEATKREFLPSTLGRAIALPDGGIEYQHEAFLNIRLHKNADAVNIVIER